MYVCLIENDAILRITLVDDLKEAGYRVHGFDNPLTALEMLRIRSADVVITDVLLMPIDGFEFMDRIQLFSPQTKVIMTVSRPQIKPYTIFSKGAYGVITKPVQTDHLFRLLDRIQKEKDMKNFSRFTSASEIHL